MTAAIATISTISMEVSKNKSENVGMPCRSKLDDKHTATDVDRDFDGRHIPVTGQLGRHPVASSESLVVIVEISDDVVERRPSRPATGTSRLSRSGTPLRMFDVLYDHWEMSPTDALVVIDVVDSLVQ